MTLEPPVPELPGDSVEQRLIDGIVGGLPPMIACDHAGVALPTFYEWLREGEKAREKQNRFEPLTARDARYARFHMNLQEKLANRALSAVANIRNAGQDPKYWKADAWLLSKWFPEYYGDKIAVEHTGGQVISINVPSDEERYKAMAAAMREANIPLPAIEAEVIEDAEIIEEREEA